MGFLDLFRGGPFPRLPWVSSRPGRTSLPPVRLPRDERPHDNTVEWWHYMGYVEPQQTGASTSKDSTKARTSFVLSILKGQLNGLSCLVGVAITIDHERKTHNVSTKVAPLNAAYFEPEDGKALCFHFGPHSPSRKGPPEAFSIRGGMGKYTLGIDTDIQLALELSQDTPAVFLDKDGVFHYRGLAAHEQNALDRLTWLVDQGIGILDKLAKDSVLNEETKLSGNDEEQTKKLLDEANQILDKYPRLLVEKPDFFATGANVLDIAHIALQKNHRALAQSVRELKMRLQRAAFVPRNPERELHEEMAYYLWPAMSASGILGTGTNEQYVEGRAWMEHQWGELPIGDYQWRYLAVIMDAPRSDDSDAQPTQTLDGQLIFFEFGRRRGGLPTRHLYHIDEEGRVRTVHGVIKVEDNTTKAGYPLIETIDIREIYIGGHLEEENGPSPAQPRSDDRYRHIRLHVEPVRNDQVCKTNLPESLLPVFWEGACHITVEDMDSKAGKPNTPNAWGMMELAGYP